MRSGYRSWSPSGAELYINLYTASSGIKLLLLVNIEILIDEVGMYI